MAKGRDRWTLEDRIDFTVETEDPAPAELGLREAVRDGIYGLEGAAARRVGLRIWLEGVRTTSAGTRFVSALGMTSTALCGLLFLAGISGVLGMVDHERNGVHVTLFLAILLGGQWLVLLLALAAAVARRRTAEGFSMIQSLLAKAVRRIAGEGRASWWERLTGEGSAERRALLWRLARMAQAAGVAFNLGVLAGLAGLVLFRHVGFYWETSTEVAMHELLEKLTRWMSIPWSSWWQEAVPGAAVIDGSRWLPGRELPPGPAAWWRFLWMAVLVWGLVPRALLWFLAWRCGRRALGEMEFQSRAARALWRDLTASGRDATDDRPQDGVLVLDVGGCGLSEESLRPFLLRALRVHASSWHQTAVLDAAGESEVSAALGKAPAGVILLAEGWALSPARMKALHERVRSRCGRETPLNYLVANVGADGAALPPTAEELREWERFVDALADPHAEVYGYTPAQTGA